MRLAPGVPSSASQRALSASSSASLGATIRSASSRLADLLHLLGGEGGLGGTAPPEDVDLFDGALRQRVERVRRDVGCRQALRALRQHAGDVHSHVAVADHGDALAGGERELAPPIVGVAVVPADERGRGVDATQVLARNLQAAVALVAGRDHHLVVAAAQLVDREVAAHHHVAEEAELVAPRQLVVDADHRLDVLVIGRHATPDQSVGRR